MVDQTEYSNFPTLWQVVNIAPIQLDENSFNKPIGLRSYSKELLEQHAHYWSKLGLDSPSSEEVTIELTQRYSMEIHEDKQVNWKVEGF